MFRTPKDDERYSWTYHVVGKMRHYGISESRIKRIIRYPKRIEEGIAPNTVAVMSPFGRSPVGRQPYRGEIWVMYTIIKQPGSKQKKLRIITAWRYPGRSSERDPVPKEIIEEVRMLL